MKVVMDLFYIKVDVSLNPVLRADGTWEKSFHDIEKISKPYLDNSVLD